MKLRFNTRLGLFNGNTGIAQELQNIQFLPRLQIVPFNVHLAIRVKIVPPSEGLETWMFLRNANTSGDDVG